MTTLLIDIGNTRLKLAKLEAGAPSFVGAVAIDPLHACETSLRQHIEVLTEPASTVWLVSVASQAVNALVQALLSSCALHWVHATSKASGILNAYPDPTQLGPDRWTGIIGLKRHFPVLQQPIVLASFGTATTVDTLSPDAEFLGGLILPGVSMMRESLNRGTARLPNEPGELQAFPTNTRAAIASGVVAAQAGAVLRQVKQAHQRYGVAPIVCVTGGAWKMVQTEFMAALPDTVIHELPHVVLDGLAVMAQTNR